MKCQLADLVVNYETFGAGKPLVAISGIPSDHQIILSWLEPIFASRQVGGESISTCPEQA